MPCCLNGTSNIVGLGGLGQFDPGSLTVELTTAISAAQTLWQSLEAALGIGAGRREADVIVPVQNKVVATVIAPVSDYLTSINTHTHVPTCAELQAWLAQVNAAKTQWINFLTGTQWKDGRAAQQAMATLAPYWTNAINDLNKYITQYCGSSGSITGIFTNPTTGQLNLPVIALLGVGAYFLLKRGK